MTPTEGDSNPPVAAFGNVDELFTKLQPDPAQPTEGEALGTTMLYASLTEGAIDSGVWSCTVGGWDETDYAVDEVMVMVQGRLRITDTDGSVHELKAGDMFYLPKGWSGRWDVLEDMKKIYVIVAGS